MILIFDVLIKKFTLTLITRRDISSSSVSPTKLKQQKGFFYGE